MTERAQKAKAVLQQERKAKLSYAYSNDQRDQVKTVTLQNTQEWGKLWK